METFGPSSAAADASVSAGADIVLSVRALTKEHGSKIALAGIDLDVCRGEILGLVGENGAGKSTVMNILGGAYPATSGVMELFGEPYRPDDRAAALAAGVASIPQRIEVDADQVVAEAVFATSYQHRLELAEKIELAAETFEAHLIDIDPRVRLGDLSRAEQTLAMLVRLRFEESQLVLLDEVSASFNDHEIASFHSIVTGLTDQGRSVIFISHRLDEVQSLSHRIVVMRDGRIYRELVPAEAGGHEGIAFEIFDRHIVRPDRPQPLQDPRVLLRAENLTTDVLRPASIVLHRGEVLGVTGMRTSGHAELARAIGGQDATTGGHLLLDGQEIRLG